jgi:hypothetical protein
MPFGSTAVKQLRLGIALTLLLAGCQLPPPYPEPGTAARSGIPIEVSGESLHTFQLEPRQAAACVVRQVEARNNMHAQAAVDTTNDFGTARVEILMRATNKVVGVVSIRQQGPSSSAVIWTAPDFPEQRNEFITIFSGC